MELIQNTVIINAVGDVEVFPAPGADKKIHLLKAFLSISFTGAGIELNLGNGVDEWFFAVQGEIDFYPLDFGEEGYDLGWNNPLILSLHNHDNTLARVVALGKIIDRE